MTDIPRRTLRELREAERAELQADLEPALVEWANTAGALEDAVSEPLHDGLHEDHVRRRQLKEARAGHKYTTKILRQCADRLAVILDDIRAAQD